MASPHYSAYIEKLRVMPTLFLIIYITLSLGVYGAYYIRRQSLILNERLNENCKIKNGFITFIMIAFWLGAFITIAHYIMDYILLSDMSLIDSNIYTILSTFWAFQAVTRLNMVLGFEKGDKLYSNKWLTLIFGIFYFNYRVNKIHRNSIASYP